METAVSEYGDESEDVMEMQRMSITLPGELLAEIDATIGPRDLTAFIVEMARAELSRLRRDQGPVWAKGSSEAEPGTSAWMKGIREEGEARLTLRHF